jgi:hypothetical protein
MVEIKKAISVILRIPLHLFLIGSFGASIYAAANKIQGISWGTPILFGVILVAWYLGVWMSKSEDDSSGFGGQATY